MPIRSRTATIGAAGARPGTRPAPTGFTMTPLTRFGAFCLGFTGSIWLALMPDGIVHTGQKQVNPAAVPLSTSVSQRAAELLAQPGQPMSWDGQTP
jgi:hypothetical protein